MSSEITSDSQFRCMLCDFTATSKPEIGNHFLTDHMEAYVSPVKDKKQSDARNDGDDAPDTRDDGDDDQAMNVKQEEEVVAEEEQPKPVKKEIRKPRGRPKKSAAAKVAKRPVITYIELEEEEQGVEDDGEPQQLGRGMRRRKKAVPRHILRYELDDDDDDDEFVEGDDFPMESEKEKKKTGPKKKFPAIMPLSMKEKASRRGRKRSKSNSKPEESTTDEGDIEYNASKVTKKVFSRPPPSKMPLQEDIIERVLDERMIEWYKKFHERFVQVIPCPFEGCTIEITPAELDIHLQCHSPNLEGFRCPKDPCTFLCPHWTNMRVHYRKEHEPSYYKLLCDTDGCNMVFPRVDFKTIKVHVTKKHLRPALYDELMSKDFDQSKYEKYMSITVNQNDDNNASELISTVESLDVHARVTDDGIAPQATDGFGNEGASSQEDGISTEETDDKKPKKRGRPLGSTKAAKLAAGLLLASQGKFPEEKSPKPKRAPRKSINHVTFFCDICGAKFKIEETMNEHKSRHFQNDDFHVICCTECNEFSTIESTEIRHHVTLFHKSLLHLHRCEECNFSTNRYHDLKKHILVHSGSKDYMCDKCGTCTTTAYNLRVHWRRYHAPEGEKTISCFACDYKCADNGILKEHIRSKHGLMVYGKDWNNARPMPTYACTECEYVGRKKASLAYHMRIHTENRKYKCHLCPYASKTKNNLLLHVRTHEGMQPLKCPECDFRGATNKIISEHVMCKHARVRPYTCKICGWTSSYHGNMWKHVETHRKEMGDSMPDEPVSVMSTDGHMVAAPLKAPTLKKRGSGGSSGGGPKTPRNRVKRNRTRYDDMQTTIQVSVDPQVGQDDSMKDGQVVIQLPVSTMLDTQTITLAEGITEEAAMGATALSRLAQGGEITVREVHFLQGGEHQQQHHEMISYNVPPVAVTQQIIAGGDMAHVISEQQYHQHQQQQQQQQQQQHGEHHQEHHHEHHHQLQHQQDDQEQRERDRYHEEVMQQVQVVTTQENGVPTAVTEQIVRAMPLQHHQEHHQDHHQERHGEQAVVHQLIPMTLPHEAELVMSMMQAHQASISQAQ